MVGLGFFRLTLCAPFVAALPSHLVAALTCAAHVSWSAPIPSLPKMGAIAISPQPPATASAQTTPTAATARPAGRRQDVSTPFDPPPCKNSDVGKSRRTTTLNLGGSHSIIQRRGYAALGVGAFETHLQRGALVEVERDPLGIYNLPHPAAKRPEADHRARQARAAPYGD